MELIEDFSKGYWLVNADIVHFGGDTVTTSVELGREMLRHTDYPLLKIGSSHRHVQSQGAMPIDTIAVPEAAAPDGYDHALLAKDETAKRMAEDEIV